jgi:hypothetical protein
MTFGVRIPPGRAPLRRLACLLGAGASCILVGWVLLVPYVASRQAGALLANLKALQVGEADFDAARHLATRHAKHLRKPLQDCSPAHCELVFEFTNSPLGALHLAQVTDLVVSVEVRQGQVIRLGALLALLARGDDYDFRAEVTELTQPLFTGDTAFAVTRRFYSGGQPHYVSVRVTPGVTSSQREEAYALNLTCLRKVTGCKSAAELLPSMWPPGSGERSH